MELDEIVAGVGNYEELQKKITAAQPARAIEPEDARKQWDPKEHAVTKRQDKTVTTDTGTEIVTVAKIPVPLQKRIVSRAAQFLCGNPIVLRATPADDLQRGLLAVVQKTWDDNKLDYESKRLAKLMMAECEVAELWYPEELAQEEADFWAGTAADGAKLRMRMQVLAGSLGDTLNPVYNKYGDMVAFGRGYTVDNAGKKEEHFDLYTATTIYQGEKGEGGWVATAIPNLLKKIPVIYYRQDAPEWHDVQAMIDRFELRLSRHADTNDYNGDPTILVKGDIVSFAKKGETGKLLQLDPNAEASYMSWDNAPESVKMELQNLRSLIYDMTDTPDISFEQMKGLGTFSGIALKMLFLGAHMKAADKEEIFGKGVQRRINFLKSALAVLQLKLQPATLLTIKPHFEYFLPKNDAEKVDMLSTAAGGKAIISQKTAVAQNPLVQDPEAEIKAIEEEANSASALDAELG
ncbi:phage portal protein [Flaviaesturariibacter amylovorans]|uniref:Phage portal protein n=1 Tax=Flaviaesturariibacter amylovorans TaxID=1084520 RepID=A0ABP8GQF9_9BACT